METHDNLLLDADKDKDKGDVEVDFDPGRGAMETAYTVFGVRNVQGGDEKGRRA